MRPPVVLARSAATLDLLSGGRGPLAIRRMYNVFGRFGSGAGFLQGSVVDWAEQLAGLALVSTEPSRTSQALEYFSGTVDLLTDTLLSHLSYEERELLLPLATYGMG